jgi:hypothetical protein
VLGVVAPRAAPIVLELDLGAFKQLLGDDRWHGDRNPVRAWSLPLADPRVAHVFQGGPSPLRGDRLEAVTERRADVHLVLEDAADTRRNPHRPTLRAGNLRGAQAFEHHQQRRALLEVPGEDLLHDRRFARLEPHASGVSRSHGINAIPVRRSGPREQHARFEFRQATTSHAFADQTAFVLGDRASDLQQELIVRVVAHGALDEFHAATALLEFFDQQDLMHVLARQSIRRGDQHEVDFVQVDLIAQAIQSWAIEFRAAERVVTEDVLGRDRQAALLEFSVEAFELLFDRLRLGLAGTGDAGVQRGSGHDRPPRLEVGEPIGRGVDKRGPGDGVAGWARSSA